MGYIGFYRFHGAATRSQPKGYKDSAELAARIEQLPEIAGVGPQSATAAQWDPYISLARSMRVSDPEIVNGALRQASGVRPRMQSGAKLMILLRVCFECPAGRSPSGLRGGWISIRGETGKKPNDMNWPVGQRFGRFYLRNTLDGYMGTPYDALGEFEWMLANCRWRNL